MISAMAASSTHVQWSEAMRPNVDAAISRSLSHGPHATDNASVVGAFRGSALYPYPDSFLAWESRLFHVAAAPGRAYGRSGAKHHGLTLAGAFLGRS